MQTFPLNYFSALRTPTQVFAGRKLLSWPKFFLIFVFLVSLMVMPVTLFYANQIQAIPLEQFLSVHSLIDEQGTQKFSELELSETGLQSSQQTIAVTHEILVGVSLSEKQQSDHGTFIDFEKEQWVIQQKDKSGIRRYTMNYSPSFQPDSVRTPEDFQRFLEREFYASNRPTIILSYSLSLGLVLFVMTSLILFGASFFLWMTRKSQLSSIHTFKESANLMLNVMGIGSMAAAVVGFIHFDFILMLSVQTTITVLLLLWVFVKTRFKDKRVE